MERISYHFPGESQLEVDRGDILLHKRDGFLPDAIRMMQRLGMLDQYAAWTHASFVVAEQGYIQEALERGVEIEALDKYDDEAYVVIHTGEAMSKWDLLQCLAFAKSVRLAYGGKKYGYLTILSIAMNLLLNTSFRFGMSGTMICSGFVCETLRPAGYIWPREAADMKPGDIALYFTTPWPGE